MRFILFRNIITLLAVLVFFAIPYIRINDAPALLIDFPNLKVHAFGVSIWFADGIYIALLIIVFLLIFFWISVTLGRVFCSFACPQTITLALKNWVKRRTKNNRVAGIIALLLATAVGSFALVSYFSPPSAILQNLLAGDIHANNIKGLIFVYLVISAVALTDRRFCKVGCPYAKFMLVMQTPNTMTTTYLFNRDVDCIRCHKCVKSCPMGIDLKEGDSPDCINCGNCIVACEKILERFKKPTLFYFKISRKSFTQFPAVALASLAIVLMVVVLVLASVWTPFKVSYLPALRSAEFSYYDDETLVNNYFITIQNKRKTDESFYLIVRTPLEDIDVKSPVYVVPAGDVATFPFELRIPPSVYRNYSNVTFTTYAIKTKEYTNEERKRLFLP